MSINNQIFTLTALNLAITGNNGSRLAAVFSPAMLHLQTTSIEVVDAVTLQPVAALIKHSFIDGSSRLIHPLAPYSHSLNNRYYSESAALLDTYTSNMMAALVGGKTTVAGIATVTNDTAKTVQKSATIGTAYSTGTDSKSALMRAFTAAAEAAKADIDAQLAAIKDSEELQASIAEALKVSGSTTIGSLNIDGKDYIAAIEREKWADLAKLTAENVASIGCILKPDWCEFSKGLIVVGNYHASNKDKLIESLERTGYTGIKVEDLLDNARVTAKLPKQFA